jgi:hypothetical protein
MCASFVSRTPSKLVYGGAIFSSAFLLFQVQPLIAKIILPWFGGGAAVCSDIPSRMGCPEDFSRGRRGEFME